MSLNIGAIEVAKLAAGFEQMARDDGKVPDQNELDTLSNTLERTLAVLTRETGEEHVSQQTVETRPASPALNMPADSLEKDLHLAIERRELDVEYQPFVDRAGAQVLGVEALVALAERRRGRCASSGIRANRRTDRVHCRNG